MEKENEDTGLTGKAREVKEEIITVGTQVKDFAQKALVIGGAVALGYVLYRQIACAKKSNTGVVSALLMTVASALATQEVKGLLLAGKEKLTRALQPR